MTAVSASAGYEGVLAALAGERCVVLDGGIGTELAPRIELDEPRWAEQVLLAEPAAVEAVHRSYLDAGCDVVTTNTWGLAAVAGRGPAEPLRDAADRPLHWLDLARRALDVALGAREASGRESDCAIAFSLNAELDSDHGRETLRLLDRAFADAPPDLLLLETLAVVRPSTFETVAALVATGLPVWISFRRCRHGLCGVHGEHWGGPEGDSFGRAARRFEELGIDALLVNCIPPDHVPGMVSWLRDFTDLPLGVYPNFGYLSSAGWRAHGGSQRADFAELARTWREEGAQIIGGCCGVGPEHLAAARVALEGVPAGSVAPAYQQALPTVTAPALGWTDRRDRSLHPLPFPDLLIEPGVQEPQAPSFMLWKHLFQERVGAHQRCLDVGCGSGVLAVQLALNGARHVHAIDIEPRAVANTLANAFRNGVEASVTASRDDVYPWVPEERYDVVLANLWQCPADPEAVDDGRADYWGSNQLEQLIAKLADALASDGVAYLVELSILSQRRIAELLEASGFSAAAIDYTLFGFPPEYERRLEQIARVEERSDAYHLSFGGREVMAAYLLEVRHANTKGSDYGECSE